MTCLKMQLLLQLLLLIMSILMMMMMTMSLCIGMDTVVDASLDSDNVTDIEERHVTSNGTTPSRADDDTSLDPGVSRQLADNAARNMTDATAADNITIAVNDTGEDFSPNRSAKSIADESGRHDSNDVSDENNNHKRNSKNANNGFLLLFLQTASNRTALCSLLNGTCALPTECVVQELALPVQRPYNELVGHFDCNLTTICCYSYSLSALVDFTFDSNRRVDSWHRAERNKYRLRTTMDDDDDHDDDDDVSDDSSDDDDDERGYRGKPLSHALLSASPGHGPLNSDVRRSKSSPGQAYGVVSKQLSYHAKPFRAGKRSKRPRATGRRTTRRRRPKNLIRGFFLDSRHYHDVTNRTALCELRSGVCVLPSECATNSAIEVERPAGHLFGDDYGDGRQVRSFMCNVTALCCLPAVGSYFAGFSLANYRRLDASPYDRRVPTYRELTSLGYKRRGVRRRNHTSFPVGNVHVISDAVRTSLCSQSNGTCTVPTGCHGDSDGYRSFHCNLTSVCCLPLYPLIPAVTGLGLQFSLFQTGSGNGSV